MLEKSEFLSTANLARIPVHGAPHWPVNNNSNEDVLFALRQGNQKSYFFSFFVREKIELSYAEISQEAQGNHIDNLRFADDLARNRLYTHSITTDEIQC